MASIESEWEDFEAANPIRVAKEIETPHPITRRTAEILGHPFSPPEDVVLHEGRWFCVRGISSHNANLALRIIDALIKACEMRGFELRKDADNQRHSGLSIFLEGEPIPLELVEHGAVVTHLSLEFGRTSCSYKMKKTWKDRPRRRLETRLNEVMLSLRYIVANRIAARLAEEQEERRMQALHDERDELRTRVEAEQRELDTLYTKAANWQQAQVIRAYIAAVEAQPVTKKQRKERKVWTAWAHDQADRLDPLSVSPPSILDTPHRRYRKLGEFEILNEDGSIERIWG